MAPVLMALVVSAVLAGCGSAATASTARTQLTIWYGTDDPVERVWSQALARRYESSHPNVQVRLVDYAFEDMNTKMQLALSGGTPPDLAYTTPRGPGIPAYVQAHRLRNLSAPAQAGRWAEKLRPGLLAAYNQPFSHIGAPKRSVVAVPTSLAAVGVMVNERLLHRLHLEIPHSLAEFENDLSTAKRAGLTPIGMGNADGWVGDDWYLTLVNGQLDPRSLQAEQRLDPHFSFYRPPFLHAAETLRGWARAGYFTKDFGGLDAQEGIDEFFHGSTLFQLISSSENPQISRDHQATRIPIGVFGFPHVGGGSVVPYSGYEGWVVPKTAAHAAAAISFISWLLSPAIGNFLLAQHDVPAHAHVRTSGSPSWLRQYISALDRGRPGVYIDAAPISNLNATMEANVELLLEGYEQPSFIQKSLQEVYATRGRRGSTARIDGEF